MPNSTVSEIPPATSALEEALAGATIAPPIGVHATGSAYGQPTMLSWADDGVRNQRRMTVGIEYDGNHLAVVGLRHAGRERSLQGFITADFDQTPTVPQISQRLREFNPSRGVHVQLAVTSSRAVMRRFSLPALAKKRRHAAARWQGQKLVPFQLREEESLYGFSFLPVPNKGWQVTLVAIPRADAGPVLEAIEDVGWTLQGVSVSGTHRLEPAGEAEPEASPTRAVALWSPRRGTFVAYERDQLQFHYDLGPTPDLPLRSAVTEEDKSRMASEWLKETGRAIGDALEFYLGAYPQSPPERLELMGVPEALAPLVTQWQERLGLTVVVVDVLQRFTRRVPDSVRAWIGSGSSLLTVATLAAAGKSTVDLTPPALAVARKRRSYARIARGAFIFSAAIIIAWAGLLWTEVNLAERVHADARQEFESLRKSAATAEVGRAVAQLQETEALTARLSSPPGRWMPWAKALTATLPAGAQLASFSLDLPSGVILGTLRPSARFEGRLAPSDRPHSLVFAGWIGDLDRVAGDGTARLVSSRTVEWKGRRSTEFALQVDPPRATAEGGH